MSVIEIERLTRRYGSRTGVEGVSLRIDAGSLFGFLGPNGSGKTTTIRVLLGFLRPTEGRASLFGRDCWQAGRQIRQDVGYLPGDLRLYPSWTGQQFLRLFGQIRRRDIAAAGGDLADRFSLDMAVPVRKMSRGMRQKLGLLLALAHEPQLLILDEPTASLDPLMQEQLLQLLRALAEKGHTVFFSSHTLSEVERLCDRVAIVREGRLVADETLETLRGRARRRFTIRWVQLTDAAEIKPPPFLSVDERRNRTWDGSLTGDTPQLVQWAATQPIEDLTIGHPDLDSLFRRYYAEGPKDDGS
ncbi:MAG: ABC transporter ATP-binding protein [Phycisphaerales bacterium]